MLKKKREYDEKTTFGNKVIYRTYQADYLDYEIRCKSKLSFFKEISFPSKFTENKNNITRIQFYAHLKYDSREKWLRLYFGSRAKKNLKLLKKYCPKDVKDIQVTYCFFISGTELNSLDAAFVKIIQNEYLKFYTYTHLTLLSVSLEIEKKTEKLPGYGITRGFKKRFFFLKSLFFAPLLRELVITKMTDETQVFRLEVCISLYRTRSNVLELYGLANFKSAELNIVLDDGNIIKNEQELIFILNALRVSSFGLFRKQKN